MARECRSLVTEAMVTVKRLVNTNIIHLFQAHRYITDTWMKRVGYDLRHVPSRFFPGEWWWGVGFKASEMRYSGPVVYESHRAKPSALI